MISDFDTEDNEETLRGVETTKERQPLTTGDGVQRSAEEGVESIKERLLQEPLTTSERAGRRIKFVILSVFLSCLSSILLGYDISIMSTAILLIANDWSLSNFEQEVIISSLNFAALIGSFGAGFFADRFGRRKTVAVAALVFILGATVMAVAPNFWLLLLGRIVTGAGVGTGLMIAPLYVSELSPPEVRGRLVSFSEIFINIGLLLGYAIGFVLALIDNVNLSWRLMLGVGAVPAIVLLIGVLILSESPRFLVSRGNLLDAALVLDKTSTTVEEAMERLAGVSKEHEDAQASAGSTWQGLKALSSQARRLAFVGIMVAVFQQFTGIEAAVYYTPSTLAAVGLNGTAGLGATIGVGASKLGFTLIGASLLDCVGRRILLLISSAGLAACLGLLAAASWTGMSAYVSLAGQIGFVSFFGLGWGPACWVLTPELFSLQLRGRLTGLATAMNRLTSAIIAGTFLSLGSAITIGGVHMLYCGIAVISFFFVLTCVPETAGKSLEAVSGAASGGLQLPYQRSLSRTKRVQEGEEVRDDSALLH